MWRSGGMNYTSIENIHKDEDQVLLDDLKAEMEKIKSAKQVNIPKTRLDFFRAKIARLKLRKIKT